MPPCPIQHTAKAQNEIRAKRQTDDDQFLASGKLNYILSGFPAQTRLTDTHVSPCVCVSVCAGVRVLFSCCQAIKILCQCRNRNLASFAVIYRAFSASQADRQTDRHSV